MRDPLVDPAPGDVVRARKASTGATVVLVVSSVGEGWVYGAGVSVRDGGSSPLVMKLAAWRDWSTWVDVAVLS